MQNQHTKITGYRDLTQTDIDFMNKVKAKEQEVAQLLHEIYAYLKAEGKSNSEGTRQAAIARTVFEEAFMRLSRSVAQPVSPWID